MPYETQYLKNKNGKTSRSYFEIKKGGPGKKPIE